MLEKLSLLSYGFLLTTICGGFVGTLLQQRAWRHKWEIENAEKHIETAKQIFEEVSRLMDKRLFRVDQLSTWIKRADKERVEVSLQNYREVMFDWNDNINRHLAMLQIYFGNDIREDFDFNVGAKFVKAGLGTEAVYRDFIREQDIGDALSDVRNLIGELRAEVYLYNLKMLSRIESYKHNQKNPGLVSDIRSIFYSDTKKAKQS
jgi:hypothetical protein